MIRLAFLFTGINFKLRNEGSYLGIIWYLLNPLALFFIILFVRNSVHSVEFGTSVENYPIYLLIGMVMFSLMNRMIVMSTDVFKRYSGFIKSVKIDKESMVISDVLYSFVLHVFELLILLAVIIYFDISLVGFIFIVISSILFAVFLTGIAFIISMLSVYISDISNIWNVLSQLIFFGTPIFYKIDNNTILYIINQFNPLYHFMEISRSLVIYGNIPSAQSLLWIILTSFSSLCIGLFVFSRYKDRITDIV
jgi:ABC-2 type transport system permease protein